MSAYYQLLERMGKLPPWMKAGGYSGALPQPMNAPPGPSMGPQPIMGGNARNPALGAVPFPDQQWKSATGPLAAPQAAPPKGRGFLGAIDDVFGGPDMKNLTPEQQKAARRRGLLAFGAQMLTATDPRGNRAQGLSALGQGVMAAQGGYGQGIEQGMMANMERQRAAMYAALAPLPGESTEQRYNRYLRMLDTDILQQDEKAMTSISQALNTMPKPGGRDGGLKPSDMLKERDGFYYAPDPNAPGGFSKTNLRWDQNEGRLTLPPNWQTVQSADGTMVQVNPRTGETRAVMDANGKPLMGQRRPLTEAENKNAGFYDLASAASEAMMDPGLGAPVTPMGRIVGEVPLIGNLFVSASDQERRQLGQQFINAILRRESGAAIPDSEYPKYERQYIPVYGDSPEVLARKARARANAVAGLKRSGGRAFDAAGPGVADEFGSMDADASGR